MKKEIPEGVILYGDSLFYGIGASDRSRGCGRILKRKIDNLDMRCGLDMTTEDALEKLDRILLRPRRIVVINFGNNDCRLDEDGIPCVDKDGYVDNLSAMIEKLRENKLNPFLTNLQPLDRDLVYFDGKLVFLTEELRGKDIRSAYEWQKGYSDVLVEKFKDMLIDIRSPLEDEDRKVIADDGLHPNDLGQEIIAQTIYDFLKGII